MDAALMSALGDTSRAVGKLLVTSRGGGTASATPSARGSAAFAAESERAAHAARADRCADFPTPDLSCRSVQTDPGVCRFPCGTCKAWTD